MTCTKCQKRGDCSEHPPDPTPASEEEKTHEWEKTLSKFTDPVDKLEYLFGLTHYSLESGADCWVEIRKLLPTVREAHATALRQAQLAALEALVAEKDAALRDIANGLYVWNSEASVRARACDAERITPSTLRARAEAQRKVRDKAKEVLWIGECRCDVIYTSRGLHEPNSHCGDMDELRDALSSLARAEKEGV